MTTNDTTTDLTRVAARLAEMRERCEAASIHSNPQASWYSGDVPLLLDAVEAAARLVAQLTRATYPENAPWWGVVNDNYDCVWCVGCQSESRDAPDEDGTWEGIDHTPDCPALRLDAALAAIAGGDTP